MAAKAAHRKGVPYPDDPEYDAWLTITAHVRWRDVGAVIDALEGLYGASRAAGNRMRVEDSMDRLMAAGQYETPVNTHE